MRKIISLMMVLVLGVALVGPSAFATNPDPNHINPWEYNGRPDSGDDSGWDDPQTAPPFVVVLSGDLFALWYTPHIGLTIYGFIIGFITDSEFGDANEDLHNGNGSGTDTR